jgi:hypothetical protein
MPTIKNLFAIDTGAYFNNRYDEFIPTGLSVNDFALPPNKDIPARMVRAFFKTNGQYYDGILRSDLDISPLDQISQAILNLSRTVASDKFDERVASFELQFDKELDLTTCRIISLVMPAPLFDAPEVKEACRKRWNVKPILYRFRRSTMESRTEIIYEKLGQFYETENLI